MLGKAKTKSSPVCLTVISQLAYHLYCRSTLRSDPSAAGLRLLNLFFSVLLDNWWRSSTDNTEILNNHC